ncbi:FAD-dependent oxidoreductase [Demequina aurantiaca]|uniref:FAD-dependent oxidoreductase n=1 Tax=Demequina aurantiaca TaxID=676200 RepID=UPI003D351206
MTNADELHGGAEQATQAKVVIIGAGQAGLSTAYHLARQGLGAGTDVVTLDRGPDAGGAWQHRWSALKVGDAHRIHDLPGMSEMSISFDTAPREQSARDVVRSYYAAYEEHFGLEVLRPATVVSVEALVPVDTQTHSPAAPVDDARRGTGFVVTVDHGGATRRLRTQVVVNASGTWHRPRVPQVAGRDVFEGRQLSTPEYTSAEEFAGLRVGVVGAGTSALGFLDELTAAGATTEWFTRRAPQFLEADPGLTREGGLEAVRRQDEAARAGRILPSIVGTTGLPRSDRVRRIERRGALKRRPMFARLVRDGAVDVEGDFIPLDAIVWATGFDAELDHLDQLALDRGRGGIVVRDGESADFPGLFLAGYGPQASTIGANRAGRAMARQIVSRLGVE